MGIAGKRVAAREAVQNSEIPSGRSAGFGQHYAKVSLTPRVDNMQPSPKKYMVLKP